MKIIKNHWYKTRLSSALCIGVFSLTSSLVLANGTETLGPPLNIDIASGTGIVGAGTGLLVQPGSLNIVVPGEVNQALIYWECHMATNVTGDDTITLNGAENITGTLIGGPTEFFDGAFSSTYRADITDLVGPGGNMLSVSDLDCTRINNGVAVNNGAGLLVIYDDGLPEASIEIRDGNDNAFGGGGGRAAFPPPLDTTQIQGFTFEESTAERTATLVLFFSSVSGTASGFGELRPSAIEVTVVGGDKTVYNDLLDSNDEEEWDTITLEVSIPAGVTMLTVQALSKDNAKPVSGVRPASFAWNAAGLSVPAPAITLPIDGRMTGGGSIDGQPVTHGFEIHCNLADPNNLQVNWGPRGRGRNSNRFHMTALTSAVCTEDPAIDQLPRPAPFDTFTGEGTGRFNGVDGATIEFVFVDAGEPGAFTDSAKILITDANGRVVLDVSGLLDRGGNHQAHPNNK